VLLYVCLDGFDLGIGILFPFAGSPAERDTMMASVAPVWDGTRPGWCWAAAGFRSLSFAYAALMPALYIPS